MLFFAISWFVWTDGRHYIDGGDVFFPIDQILLLSKISSPWWPDQLGSIAFNISVIPLRAVFAALQWIGLSSIDIERLFLAAGYGISSGAMYLCANEFWRERATPVIAAIWYPCGIAFCMALPNENNVVALAVLPLLVLFALKTLGDIRYAIPFVAVTTSFGFIAANPPTAVLFAAIVAIVWLIGAVGRAPARRVILAGAVMFVGSVLCNLWWAILAKTALSANALVAVGVNDLLWTLGRSNLVSVIEQTSYWGFGTGFDPWLTIGQWYLNNAIPHTALVLTPILAFSMLWYTRAKFDARRATIAALVVLCLIAVFLTKGEHPPFVGASAWLYAHMPGMFLYREPVKFLFILTFVVPLLAAASHGEFLNRLPAAGRYAMTLLFVAVPVVTGWSLLTGWAFAFEGSQARVQVPDYWQEAASFINTHDGEHARVLLLPEDGFYQTRYRWGLEGQDRIAETSIKAPVIRLRAQQYAYMENEYAGRALGALETALRMQRGPWLAHMFSRLSIRYVLVRGDLTYDGRILSLPEVRYDLALVHARRVASFGPLDLYDVGASARVTPATGVLRSCASPQAEIQAAMRLAPSVTIVRSQMSACRGNGDALTMVDGRGVNAPAHSVVVMRRAIASTTTSLHRPRRLGVPAHVRVAAATSGDNAAASMIAAAFEGGWHYSRDASGWSASRTIKAGNAAYIHISAPASHVYGRSLAVDFQWLPGGQSVPVPFNATLQVSRKSATASIRLQGGDGATSFGRLKRVADSLRLTSIFQQEALGASSAIGYPVNVRLDRTMSIGTFEQPAEFVFRLPSGQRISAFVKPDAPASYAPGELFEEAYQPVTHARTLRRADVVLEAVVLPFASEMGDGASASITTPARDSWSAIVLSRPAHVAPLRHAEIYVGRPVEARNAVASFRSTPWWTGMTIDAVQPGWIVMKQAYSDYWAMPRAASHAVVDGYANGWYVKAPGRYAAFVGLWYTQRVLYLTSILGFFALIVFVAFVYRRYNEAQ